MEHNTTLVKDLKHTVSTLGNVLEAIKQRVYDLNDDINENVAAIEEAYNEIKADKAELAEIVEATKNIVCNVEEIHEEAKGTCEDGENIINDMYPLVEDSYIEDLSYRLIESNGKEVARDRVEKTDYVATKRS